MWLSLVDSFIFRQSVREELINFRANEPDEAIGASAESGIDDEYERIVVMKYEKELESKFGKSRLRDPSPLRKRAANKKHSKSPSRSDTPPVKKDIPLKNKSRCSDDEDIDWELIQKDELDIEEASNRRNLSGQSSSSGSFINKPDFQETPLVRRRNRSSTRDNRSHQDNNRKTRSSSLQPGSRSSSEFCDQLAKRLSGEIGQNFNKNIQVKRRDSFLDISIPLDDSRSCESMESLLFFSQTITDTANTFQDTLNKTAEKFSKTLDETAATLKKAVSEKSPTQATTQELTKTLHKTAEILSKTSEVLSETAKSPPTNMFQQKNKEVEQESKNNKMESHNQPLRLDTITSQSEIDPSDTDTEDIMKYVPVNQPLQKVRDMNQSAPSFSPIDPKIAEISTQDDTRPSSASSGLSFVTPFGKTTNTKPVKDIFNKMKEPDNKNPFSCRPPANKYRAESKSPERLSGIRGRDSMRGPAPLNRTQSAAQVTRKPRSISVDTHGKTIQWFFWIMLYCIQSHL